MHLNSIRNKILSPKAGAICRKKCLWQVKVNIPLTSHHSVLQSSASILLCEACIGYVPHDHGMSTLLLAADHQVVYSW